MWSLLLMMGGVSSYTAIRPILEKYGLKGVFFIATNYIGTDGFMSAEQIEQLSDMGHSIGSHSCSHPERMDILSKDELNREWIESSNLLTEIIGHGIDAASIPNGYSSKAVINAIKDAGFKKIYTSKPTTKVIEKGGISIIGRYAVTSDMTTEYVLGLVSSRKARMKIELRNAVLGMAKAVMGNFYLTVRKKLLAHE